MKLERKFAWSAGFLVLLHVAAILAGFLAPYSYESQDRMHPFVPPTRVHWVDCTGHFHLRPFVYLTESRPGSLTDYVEDCSQRFPLRVFLAGDEYSVAGMFQANRHLFGVELPAHLYLLGGDGLGRDQFSRILYGGQVSLFAGLAAALLSVLLGLLLGLFAGFYGGVADSLSMRITEVIIAVPPFYVLLAARSFLPLQVSAPATFLLIVGVIGLTAWGRPARLVRGVVLSARERNFVLAARGFGASRAYLLRRHIMPLTLSVALTQMAVFVPQFIVGEVVISFLGLGMGEPVPSWGNMLAAAQQYRVLTSYWWMLLPGFASVPVSLAYHFLADSLGTQLQSQT
ncbi:MAG TPA: ABC transporter permease [Terriglobales bacterium]|nr:ABC transporter permease [Terriglobales bacterium]